MSMQRGISQFQKLIAKFTARANLSVRQGGGEALNEFVYGIASITIRLTAHRQISAPNRSLALPQQTLISRLREQGQQVFDRMVED
jgi:hypothetical protein